jgi:L-fuculose-phosphate aldolase
VNHRELREEVARVAKQMIASGLVTGTSGNVSARTPEGDVLMTPSGLDYGELEPGDVVLVDVNGQLLEGSLEPSTETPMHTGIYRARPEVGAVVHTHSIFATTLACLGWPIPPVHYMLTTLAEQLAAYAAEALGESSNACLLQNHGTITVGGSPEAAFSRTVVLEEMAEVYYRTRVAGEPVLLTPGQIEDVAARISGYGQTKPAPADSQG